jgi:Domain of unknown function (DUF4263)
MDRTRLETAIAEIDAIIEDPDSRESDFQGWFERHAVVFELLGYQRVLPHPELKEPDRTLIPDFLCQRIDGLWDVIEIKRADTAVLKDTDRRKAFYADMETYLSQAGQDYAKHFNDRAHREAFLAKYGVAVQEQPDSIVIAGRSEGLDRREVHRLLSGRTPRIELQTYDDVRNRLEFQRLRSFGPYEGMPGLSIHAVLSIERPPGATETGIIDIGLEPDRNRLYVKTDAGGDLVFGVIDKAKRLHQTVIKRGADSFEYGQTVYLCLEVGGTPDRAMVLAEVNGLCCSEAKLDGLEFSVESPLAMVMGSDFSGSLPSAMRMLEQLAVSKTLTFRERLDLRGYIAQKHGPHMFDGEQPLGWLEYIGHKFMCTVGHPSFAEKGDPTPRSTNLVQPDPAKRPIAMGPR